MPDRPYVILSAAMSLDGHLDDNEPGRLVLSSEEDFQRVDQVRSTCDAILIGATTLRRDNPTLRIKNQANREARIARGEQPELLRVIPTRSGDIPGDLRLWSAAGPKRLYCPPEAGDRLKTSLGHVPDLEIAVWDGTLSTMLADLEASGIRRMVVEGGEQIHTWFFAEQAFDEVQLTVSGFFVSDPAAPRFTSPGVKLPQDKSRRLHLEDVSRAGETAVLTYRAVR